MNVGDSKKKTTLNRQGLMGIRIEIIANVLLLSLLLISAGKFFWINAWLYTGIQLICLMSYFFILFKKNPDLLNARGKIIKKDTKKFDKIFYKIARPLIYLMMIVAGCDAVRYEFSSMSFSISIVCAVLFLLTDQLMSWTVISNTNYEASIRIQNDRGHQVCDWGPYRIVRHPGYVGNIVKHMLTPFILGSFLALIPAIALACLWIIRTSKEDSILYDELQGYKEYTNRVSYRLVPGIW